jgi:hypothetical protein
MSSDGAMEIKQNTFESNFKLRNLSQTVYLLWILRILYEDWNQFNVTNKASIIFALFWCYNA